MDSKSQRGNFGSYRNMPVPFYSMRQRHEGNYESGPITECVSQLAPGISVWFDRSDTLSTDFR